MKIKEIFLTRSRYLMFGSILLTLLVAAVIWWVLAFLFPMPPRVVVMATGPQGGAYAEFGSRYREILAREGFEVRIVQTAGSGENLSRLQDLRSGVNIAFLQAGLTTAAESPDLISLGTIAYEPLWIFYRRSLRDRPFGDLRGLRISIGPEGSGTRALMLKILALNRIGERDVDLHRLSPDLAKEQLLRGEIDVATIVTAGDSPVVRELLANEKLGLVSLPRLEAYLALHPYLDKVKVPAGVGDLTKNLPDTDVTLLASKASLVVRQDIHPALQYLLLEAASQIHSGPGFFKKAGQFPAPEAIDLPLSADARHFYKSGPPFLQRYLPFWLAVIGERLLVLLIPLVGVVYPLLTFMPTIYQWVMRRRIFRLYKELKLLEIQLAKPHTGQDIGDLLSRLEGLEERVNQLHLPVTFMPMVYSLRSHTKLAREWLESLRGDEVVPRQGTAQAHGRMTDKQ